MTNWLARAVAYAIVFALIIAGITLAGLWLIGVVSNPTAEMSLDRLMNRPTPSASPAPSPETIAPSEDRLSDLIPPGKRAVTVRIAEVRGGQGALLPGDRVEVLVELVEAASDSATPDPKAVEGSTGELYTIAPESLVLALGGEAKGASNSQKFEREVTLALSPKEAQLALLGQEQGRLVLVRSLGGN